MGQFGAYNGFKATPGPTSLAKRQIIKDDNFSTVLLSIDMYTLDTMKKCTETETRSKTGNYSWNVTRDELLRFIAVMYARGVLAKGQLVNSFWSE